VNIVEVWGEELRETEKMELVPFLASLVGISWEVDLIRSHALALTILSLRRKLPYCFVK
jgi:hypothetical protein